MAPRYAPSLRSRFPPLLLLLQTAFIVIFALFTETGDNVQKDEKSFRQLYTDFQDVNVLVVLGFGFSCCFLLRHGFSGSAFSLLVAAVATQWALILNGLESWFHRGRIRLDLRSLVVAEMCTTSALVSIGAVLGKTNPVHLVLVALLEVSAFILNQWLLRTLLKVRLLDSVMLLHVFGSFFGLTLAWILYRKGSEQRFEKEKFDQRSGLFSMLGTVFLWVFWPTFNSVLVDDGASWRKLGVICSTYLALAVSAVTAAAVSVLFNPRGRLNPLHLQSCISAGGVAVGVSVSSLHQPFEAMIVGFCAAVVSTVGFHFLKIHMLLAFQCHDTRAVLSSHGLPGLLGWVVQLVLQIKGCQDHTAAIRFSVFHICTLLITISISLSTGILTGFLLKLKVWRPQQDRKCFDDQAFWEFPNLAVRK